MDRNDENRDFLETSFLYGGNASYIEKLYAEYQDNPSSVDPQWAKFFATHQADTASIIKEAQGPSWARSDWPQHANGELVSALDGDWGQPADETKKEQAKTQAPQQAASTAQSVQSSPVPEGVNSEQAVRDTINAISLIRAYRYRGHLNADLDPLKLSTREPLPELELSHYGFGEGDMDRQIFIDNFLGLEYATLREILDILKRTYCSTFAVEYAHISKPEEKAWLQERIEGSESGINFTPEGKKAILNKLIEAEGFENFLNVKYTGTKRFGLDGGESLLPALEQVIKRGGQLGVKDIVLGMAHRGRLNVLSQVMGKPPRAIFNEFKGGSSNPDDVDGSGDVKYHLGASSDREFDGNNVHLSLTANPSHLEIVNPVVLGKVRAKQDQRDDRPAVLPLLIHGDAAFAGQGVVPECFGLSGLKGHRTAGSIHFIVNNQIGFTTAPRFSRSSPYPTDVAKMVETPVFHVNGDDPEAVVYAAKVAIEFRQKFNLPVVIDIFCYRRHGHNEGDEPNFTQPLMYQKISKHPTTLTLYAERLIKEGVITEAELQQMRDQVKADFQEEFDIANDYKPNKADWLDGAWSGLQKANELDDPRRGETGVESELLEDIGIAISDVPKDLNIHKTINRFMQNRAKMIETGEGIDWAMAEALAFGSLIRDGYKIRLSGQDCERGTFSQRHSVLVDQKNESMYTPLNTLTQYPKYEVINSMLSEEAVLGFEYGYSLAEPNGLTLWEAQFGDFANGAQVLFDQFISSGERKWLRMSGLVTLLPHGYEGQGPEHSSARLERFLQICAEDNMQVANCTTPANYFHILRRQLCRDFRKPLILMTPKSLLRHKKCVSRLDELVVGTTFHRILWDDAQLDDGKSSIKLVEDENIKRVILCSGKVYFDLLTERDERQINDIYLMRVEQLYPFPAKALLEELQRFPNAEIIWCQEEPKNMGSWTFVQPYIEWVLEQLDHKNTRPSYVGRNASAATATGLMSQHIAQLQSIFEQAFGE